MNRVAVAFAAVALSAAAFAQGVAPADAIYVGGDIVTMNDKAPAPDRYLHRHRTEGGGP